MARFEVANGRIIGLGNGDPNCHEPEKGDRRSLFNGYAQVIVQSESGTSGRLRLSAHADGLRSARTHIAVRRASPPPSVQRSASAQTITDYWRVSPPSAARPDPLEELAEQDMNSWGWANPSQLQPAVREESWVIFRSRITPRRGVQLRGGTLTFNALVGRAEIWVDGALAARKTAVEVAPVSVRLPSGEGAREVNVLIHAPAATPFGFDDVATIVE
jgi:beta-galactosidase